MMSYFGLFLILFIITCAVVTFVVMWGKAGGVLANVKELTENQVIDSGQAEKIKFYYQSKKANSKLAAGILSIVGAILVGLGIVLVFVHNWHELPKMSKLGVGSELVIISLIIFIRNISKKKTSLLAVEGSSVLLALMVGAATFLIGKAYNLPITSWGLLLIWMILILPIPYIYGSALTGIIYMIGITIWIISPDANLFEFSEKVDLIMYLPIIPFALKFISHNKFTVRERLVELVLFVVIVNGLMILTSTTQNPVVNPFVMFNMIVVVILFISSIMKKLNLNMTKLLAKITIVTQMLLVVISGYPYYIEDGIMYTYIDVFNIVVSMLMLLVAMLGFYYFVKNNKSGKILYAITPVLLIFSEFANKYQHIDQAPFYVVNIYLIIVAVILIYRSTIVGSLSKLNSGWLITIILSLRWFFDNEAGVLERATGFIIIGAILIIFNMLMLKKKKALVEREEVSK